MSAAGPRFQSVDVFPTLVPERGEAALAVVSEFAAASETPVLVRAEILQSELPVTTIEDPITVFRSDTSLVQSGVIPRVALWWPNGYGRPSLYEARVSLLDLDERLLDQRKASFGVRQIEAVSAGEPDGPLQLRVNGRAIALHGVEWQPLPQNGEEREQSARLLRLARAAGVNLLHVRGDEAPEFYRHCDEYGLLVWQELSGDEPFSERLRMRTEETIERLRAHPCLAAWGAEAASDALVREVVELEDPDRPLIPGAAGTAPRPAEGDAALFGEAAEPERAANLLQALTVAEMAETRRRAGSGGVLPVAFCGPRALVEQSGQPRPAYYALKRAWSAFLVTAESPTFSWASEGAFRAEVWLLNSGEERSLLNVVATVVDLQGRELYQENLAGEAPEGEAENVGDLYWRFPAGFAEPFLLFLEVIDEEGDVIARNAYHHSRASEPVFAEYLDAPSTTLAVEIADDALTVRNTGRAVALCVEIRGEGAQVADSAFPLAPGAVREISVRNAVGPLSVTAWNAPPL